VSSRPASLKSGATSASAVAWTPDPDRRHRPRNHGGRDRRRTDRRRHRSRLATRHLLQLGHSRLLHVDGGRAPVPQNATRLPGSDARRPSGTLASIIPGGLTEADGSRAAGWLIDGREADSATAAVVFNDQLAVGLLATLRASGINVPRQVSVVGYEDSRLARASWARLTTISQDSAAIARAAVERAIARVAGEPAGRPVLIKPTPIERATTAPPTAGPPKAPPGGRRAHQHLFDHLGAGQSAGVSEGL
jgi:DNA-binding LacI/PurR family transcriptional regulator